MAWNEPGGNKNDNDDKDKNKNPWGSGGNKPPDLEQLFTEFVNKIKSALGMGPSKPNHSGGLALPIIIIFIAIGSFAIWTASHKIGPSERGVVLTFGKYDKTMEPGLNFTWPSPISEVYKVDTQKLHSVGEEGEMLTEDKNLVFLEFAIQYRIREDEVQKYLFKLESPDSTVKHAAESSVRQIVGTNSMSHFLNENRKMSIDLIVQELQQMLDDYSSGIQVTNFNFKEVHPPAQVKPAFDDVVKAREDAKTYINEANEYAKQEVPLAEGNALKIIQDAEAYKEATITQAEGKSQQFNLVREQYELAPEVTKERLYLETMEKVFTNTSKVLIDSKNSNNMMYLPLDQMLKNSHSNNNDSVYLGTTTVTAPSESKNSSYERANTTKRTGRGNR
jgi:membrane protease subunit HflK